MATIGQAFKSAREKKNVTASQAAAAIRSKVQVIEAMERDDFSRMAAPMYAKGFIRLYAEYLGLDPTPLLREYSELHSPRERPPLVAEEAPKPKDEAAAKVWAERTAAVKQFLAAVVQRWKRPVAALAGVVVLLFLMLLGVGRCSRQVVRAREMAPPPPAEKRTLTAVVSEPPEPYLEGTSASAQPP